ncbi:hypothetical protein BLNAU_9764 [Blattamonas nauphoetae]|uniref:Protein kinase domain-containing protein n=1 Tax=Blattamonas nauphoetae TaxID=2049346 RepID=A0ABQ9XUR2_9EUKA|nr:hypothetical protein BLNAU_9764 [Blattamonas nauphoetae]
MELLGENLKTLLSRFSPGRVLPNIQRHYALEMLNCIEALHSRGWIHCDITPWHFVERNRSARNGHLVLVGFGKAERHDSSPLFNEVPTVRTFQGTAKYGSSHVIVGGEGSFRDDLWSWFFIVLEMKVGHLPWSGEESLSEMARIREEWEHQMRLHSLPPRASSILDPSDVAHPTRSNMPNTTQTSLPYTFPPHSTICPDDSEQPGHFQIERKNTEIDENLVLIFRHLADLKFGEKPNYSLLRQLLQREWAVHVPPMGLDHSSSNELDASPFSSFRASDNSRMEISLSHGRLLEIHSPFGSNSRTTRDGENPNAEERHSEAGKMQRSTSCDTHLKMEKDDETATSPKHHTTFHTFDLAHPLLRTPTVCGACVGSSARLWFGEERVVAGPQPLLRLVRRLLAAPADSACPTRSFGAVVVTSIADSVIADSGLSFSVPDTPSAITPASSTTFDDSEMWKESASEQASFEWSEHDSVVQLTHPTPTHPPLPIITHNPLQQSILIAVPPPSYSSFSPFDPIWSLSTHSSVFGRVPAPDALQVYITPMSTFRFEDTSIPYFPQLWMCGWAEPTGICLSSASRSSTLSVKDSRTSVTFIFTHTYLHRSPIDATPKMDIGFENQEEQPDQQLYSPSLTPSLCMSSFSSFQMTADEQLPLGFFPLPSDRLNQRESSTDLHTNIPSTKPANPNTTQNSSSTSVFHSSLKTEQPVAFVYPELSFEYSSSTSIVYLPSMSVMDQQTSMMSWGGEEAGRVSEWIGTGDMKGNEWEGLIELKEGKRRKWKEWKEGRRGSSQSSLFLTHKRLSLFPIGSSRSIYELPDQLSSYSMDDVNETKDLTRTLNKEVVRERREGRKIMITSPNPSEEGQGSENGDEMRVGGKNYRPQQSKRWEVPFGEESDDERDMNSTSETMEGLKWLDVPSSDTMFHLVAHSHLLNMSPPTQKEKWGEKEIRPNDSSEKSALPKFVGHEQQSPALSPTSFSHSSSLMHSSSSPNTNASVTLSFSAKNHSPLTPFFEQDFFHYRMKGLKC